MKTRFLLFFVLLLPATSWGQLTPPVSQSAQPARYSVRAINNTPTDIAGERQLLAGFSVRRTRASIWPVPRVTGATLFYSRDKARLQATVTQAQALTTNVGVSSASATRDVYGVTFAHAGNPSPAGSIAIPVEDQGSQVYKTGDKVFFKWRVALRNPLISFMTDARLTQIDSFIMPRALNIAVVGDSYASGEGAPNRPSPPWLDQNAHRSRLGGEFAALQTFKARNPGLDIRCDDGLYVACSGAGIREIVDLPFNPNFCDRADNSQDSAQLTQLVRLFEGNKYEGKLDALVISVGGNNVGFAEAVKSAFGGQLADNIGPLTRNLPRLDTLYRAMADRIDSLCVQHVFAMQYPDPHPRL
jgi:hypothetical protein